MRARQRHALAAVLLAGFSGAAVAQPQASDRTGELDGDYVALLRAKSCPTGVAKTGGEAVAISAAPVPLQGINPSRKTIGELTFVAGFHLTIPDERFGGL